MDFIPISTQQVVSNWEVLTADRYLTNARLIGSGIQICHTENVNVSTVVLTLSHPADHSYASGHTGIDK